MAELRLRARAPLPSVAQSAYGQEFCPAQDCWTIHDFGTGQRLHFHQFDETVAPQLKEEIKQVFLVLAQTRNANTCRIALDRVRGTTKAWLKYAKSPLTQVTPELLVVALQAGLGMDLWRMVLRVWVLQDSGEKVAEALDFAENSLAARKPRSTKTVGESVLVWDSKNGAYRPEEDEAIRVALDDGFSEGNIARNDYTMIRLFRGLGMRPVQLAAMKVCDFRKNGERFEIRIPLAKQRGLAERQAFMPWKQITQGLGLLLSLHINESVVPRLAEGVALEDAPLFVKVKGVVSGPGLEHHVRPDSIRKTYVRIFQELSIVSPITGEVIEGTPRRDRHTYLTMLAMDGCTKEQIAANAGHSNPNSCEVYVEASTDHFQRMESIVGAAFVPVADRFMGRVIAREQDEQAKKDADSVLLDRRMTSVGSCEVGGCHAIEAGVAPVACYTCRKFRAWEEAPHAVLLDELEQERETLVKQGHHAVAQTKTPSIIAISDLMQAIHERKAARIHG